MAEASNSTRAIAALRLGSAPTTLAAVDVASPAALWRDVIPGLETEEKEPEKKPAE